MPEHSPPSPSPDQPRIVLARIVLALGVAAALSTHQLVEAAADRPYGPARSVLVAVASGLHQHATTWQLDGPDRALRSATGRTGRTAAGVGAPAAVPGMAGTPVDRRRPHPGPAGLHGPIPPAPSGPRVVAADPGRAVGRPVSGDEPGPIGPPGPGGHAGRSPTGDGDSGPPAAGGGGERTVTPLAKLRLWAGGDSLGEYVGNQLLHPVGDPAVVEIELDYRISTGLARPDYFDWPARIADIMATAEPPEALVFMVGGNDDQPMEGSSGLLETATPAWYEEYRRRVALVMDIAGAGGAQLFWIGLPPMRDGTRNAIAAGVNDVIEQEAATRSSVTFLDIEILFAGPDGRYSPTIADPAGRQRVARAPDGVHITYVGSSWVAERVWASVRDRWRFGDPLNAAGPGPVVQQQPR